MNQENLRAIEGNLRPLGRRGCQQERRSTLLNVEEVESRRVSRKRLCSDTYAEALAETLRTIRIHPWLCEYRERYDQKWPESHGPNWDSANMEIMKDWRQRITPYLNTRSCRRREESTRDLLDTAIGYVEQISDLLEATWLQVVQTETWLSLSLPAKWLYRTIHALAQEKDQIGGENVLLSNRAALRAISILGGPTWRSLSTITLARVELIKAGFIDVEVGQAWEAHKRSTPTRYSPLLDRADGEPMAQRISKVKSNYALIAPDGDSSIRSCESVPRFSSEQRKALDLVFYELRQVRITSQRDALLLSGMSPEELSDAARRDPPEISAIPDLVISEPVPRGSEATVAPEPAQDHAPAASAASEPSAGAYIAPEDHAPAASAASEPSAGDYIAPEDHAPAASAASEPSAGDYIAPEDHTPVAAASSKTTGAEVEASPQPIVLSFAYVLDYLL